MLNFEIAGALGVLAVEWPDPVSGQNFDAHAATGNTDSVAPGDGPQPDPPKPPQFI